MFVFTRNKNKYTFNTINMKFRMHRLQHAIETNEGDEGKTPNKNGIEIFLDCITNIWANEIKNLLLILMRLSIVVGSESI